MTGGRRLEKRDYEVPAPALFKVLVTALDDTGFEINRVDDSVFGVVAYSGRVWRQDTRIAASVEPRDERSATLIIESSPGYDPTARLGANWHRAQLDRVFEAMTDALEHRFL